MATLLILVGIVYFLIGICELIGICASVATEPHERMPDAVEALLIVVLWGWYEWKAWRERHGR